VPTHTSGLYFFPIIPSLFFFLFGLSIPLPVLCIAPITSSHFSHQCTLSQSKRITQNRETRVVLSQKKVFSFQNYTSWCFVKEKGKSSQPLFHYPIVIKETHINLKKILMEPNQHEISTKMVALFSPPPPLHSSHDWSHSEVIEEDGNGSNDTSPSKLCARGHWRPAEDAKLRELVSQFGPQNWNLIAEKLEGRSGWFFVSYLCHNISSL
jgi:Myb-like DNA-binding domain